MGDAAADNYVCGWCGTTSPAILLREDSLPRPGSWGDTRWALLECAACERWTIEVGNYGTVPPPGRELIDTAGVPPSAASDYREAVACLMARAPRATATVVRRAVQTICLDLEADPDRTLYRQIEQLRERGELTRRLADLATRLRLFGNIGAHPSVDGLDTVSVDVAAVAVRFLEHLIEHVYVIDGVLAAIEDATSGNGTATVPAEPQQEGQRSVGSADQGVRPPPD